MTPGATAATLALGFVLGLRHATEADHVVAVSTLVTERRSLKAAAGVGVLWGIGHTLALLAAGVLVLIAGLAIPEAVASRLELGVAAMIVLLGLRLLWTTTRAKPAHAHADRPAPATGVRWQPLAVGMMHGLAGSAALTLLIQAELARDAPALVSVVYLLVFGAGSILGMLAMGFAIGLPFALGGRAFAPWIEALKLAAGVGSVLFGLYYGWQAW